ncbi:NEDD4 family-interacting protein 2-like [Anneissia japonica]|uniref:NEDD4 family-interacting protein 2-like n=1 Tax=Anneissia japonica TaxID=1529436 RepID=UPI0014258009|nr:NEDD4 family-interacting protein 2-like [Anneissia japonica]
MDPPPQYEQVCREDNLSSGQVMLALVVPPDGTGKQEVPPETEDTIGYVQIPGDAPPPYDEEDKRRMELKKKDEEIRKRLVELGLLSENDFGSDSEILLGSGWVFFWAAMISIAFSWIGFLVAYCLSSSVAARCGALCGFGISMVKWTIVALYSDCCRAYLASTMCLSMALIFCGIIIAIRGAVMYLRARKEYERSGYPAIKFWYLY